MSNLISRNCTVSAFPIVAPTRQSNWIVPRAQVTETQAALLVELEMPGLTRESVEVTVENDELTVVGRRPSPAVQTENSTEGESQTESAPAPTVLLRERPSGDYKRSFVLGERLDPSAISAPMAHGILTISIPKGERAKPRTIEVR